MQTFLPYPDFADSAKALDYRRLGKQRVEAQQIIDCLEERKQGWRNHPAVKMWTGYLPALYAYRNAMVNEWIERGYRNALSNEAHPDRVVMPPWIGDKAFHATHRGNLVLKKPAYYVRELRWTDAPTAGYIWPSVDDGKVQWQDLRKNLPAY